MRQVIFSEYSIDINRIFPKKLFMFIRSRNSSPIMKTNDERIDLSLTPNIKHKNQDKTTKGQR